MKKLVIDAEVLKKNGVTPEEMLLLCSLYFNCNVQSVVRSAINKGFVSLKAQTMTMEYDKFVLNQAGIDKVEKIILDSELQEKTPDNKDRFTELAKKLRDIYPAGKKEGTAYQWRDSVPVITLRLKALVKRYGECFTDEQAINATKKYVASFNGNYKYMHLLKYFIMKNNMVDRASDTSELLSYIENEDHTETVQNDWTATLK